MLLELHSGDRDVRQTLLEARINPAPCKERGKSNSLDLKSNFEARYMAIFDRIRLIACPDVNAI